MFDVNGKNQFLRRSAVILATVFFAAPQILSAETLRDALVKAYNSSGLLEQNRALLRAADEDVAVAASASALIECQKKKGGSKQVTQPII